MSDEIVFKDHLPRKLKTKHVCNRKADELESVEETETVRWGEARSVTASRRLKLGLPLQMVVAEANTALQAPSKATSESVEALLDAARYNDMDDVKSLEASGVPLDSMDDQGRTGLLNPNQDPTHTVLSPCVHNRSQEATIYFFQGCFTDVKV